jgi:transposase
MPKTYIITTENAAEIRKAMEKKENKPYYKKLLAVALRGEGKTNEESGAITGYHWKRVSQLVSLYANCGLKALASDGRAGGNNQNMSDSEAKEFLKKFVESAEKGEIITVSAIAAAYDAATGVERKSKSTVYSFLHKYKWRLITPRPKHPEKASSEEIEESKKR